MTVVLDRDRLDHRAAELGAELVDVDVQAVRTRHVRPC